MTFISKRHISVLSGLSIGTLGITLSLCPSVSIAQSATASKNVPFAVDGIYFPSKRFLTVRDIDHLNPTSPLLGFSVPKSKFKEFLSGLAQKATQKQLNDYVDAVFGALKDLSDAEGSSDTSLGGLALLHAAVKIQTVHADSVDDRIGYPWVKFTAGDDPSIVLIPTGPKSAPKRSELSYNAKYKITFYPKALDKLASSNKAGVKIPWDSTKEFSSDILSWSGRGTGTAAPTFGGNSQTLLNDKSGAKVTTNELDLTLGYLGFPNPLQNSLFKHEDSYYDFKIAGKLFDKPTASSSDITMSLSGATNLFSIHKAMTIIGFTVETLQSATNVTLLYDLSYRFGDRRDYSNNFVAAGDVVSTPTVQVGAQFGYRYFRNVTGIDQSATIGTPLWIVRPKATLNLPKQSFAGAVVDGAVDVYYLNDFLKGSRIVAGGDGSTSLAEVATGTVTFGPKNQQLVIGISAGVTPSSQFKAKATTYSVGLNFKF